MEEVIDEVGKEEGRSRRRRVRGGVRREERGGAEERTEEGERNDAGDAERKRKKWRRICGDGKRRR